MLPRAPRRYLEAMPGPSDRSRGVAFALALTLGVFGAHRFYAGKTGTGILQLVTAGGLGIWYLYDVILVASGGFQDKEGRRLSRWSPEDVDTLDSIPPELLDEVYHLRQDVTDLQERLDFTERLLAGSREGGSLKEEG